MWNSIGGDVKRSTLQWLEWAKTHAHEIGDAGIRHLERQDLLAERNKVHTALGERVAKKFLEQDQKTIRIGTPEVAELLERIRLIRFRLAELDAEASQEKENQDS